MVMMIVNGQIGNTDGFSASQRLYGRNPRLPCSTIDSVNYLELVNSATPPEMSTHKHLNTLHSIRESRLKNEHMKVFRKMQHRSIGKSAKSHIFNGQSAYFWHADKNDKYAKWRGPGIVVGLFGPSSVLVGYHGSYLTIAIDRARPTDKVLELIGSDEQLQINTLGTKIPLRHLVDSRTLVYLMRYRDLAKNKAVINAGSLGLQDLSLASELVKPGTYTWRFGRENNLAISLKRSPARSRT